MKDTPQTREHFYKLEIEKWRNLAARVIQERESLRIQNDELKAEIQRLQNIAQY